MWGTWQPNLSSCEGILPDIYNYNHSFIFGRLSGTAQISTFFEFYDHRLFVFGKTNPNVPKTPIIGDISCFKTPKYLN